MCTESAPGRRRESAIGDADIDSLATMLGLFWIGLLVVGAVILTRRGRRSTTDFVVEMVFASVSGLMLAFVLAPSLFGWLRLLTDLLLLGVPAFLLLLVRRVDSKSTRRWADALAVLLLGLGFWSTQIEPRWLEITRHEIASPKVRQPVRLVVVSDLQTDRWGAYEQRVIDEIVLQRPDVVLMTGDYVQMGAGRDAIVAQLRRALSKSGLAPRGGFFAVGGDVEPEGWEDDFRGTRVKTFPETTRFGAAGLAFSALDRRTSRHAVTNPSPIRPSERFLVAFGHAPDFALAHPPADLMLAGHVHGGQVRLPFLGPLFTFSSVPRDWAVGRTDFDGGAQAGGRSLIVSRGLGMERGQAPRIRFLCRPELVVVDLLPASSDTLPR